VTPIVKETAAAPRTSLAVPVAAVVLLASLAIGNLGTPVLYTQAERAVHHAPAAASIMDDSQRLGLALEVYRSIRGAYPVNLRALSREGIVPAATVSSFVKSFDYQSDGTSYRKTAR
jgi:hypothetical protein